MISHTTSWRRRSIVSGVGATTLCIAVALLLGATVARSDAPEGRYEPAADTVKDLQTGLTWQLGVSTATYQGAKQYCQTLSLAGGGWRLPSLKELLTLVDPTRSKPAVDMKAFAGTPVDWFWTASPTLGLSGFSYVVSFDNGASSNLPDSSVYHVRCVR